VLNQEIGVLVFYISKIYVHSCLFENIINMKICFQSINNLKSIHFFITNGHSQHGFIKIKSYKIRVYPNVKGLTNGINRDNWPNTNFINYQCYGFFINIKCFPIQIFFGVFNFLKTPTFFYFCYNFFLSIFSSLFKIKALFTKIVFCLCFQIPKTIMKLTITLLVGVINFLFLTKNHYKPPQP